MTKDIKHRWVKTGNGYKNNADFYEAIQTYGWDNIEHIVIADNLTKNDAETLEEQLINDNKTYDSNYGYNTRIGMKWNEEYKAMMSEIMSGDNNYWFGKTFTEEHKSKLSESHSGKNNHMYGKHHSEETKQKISESNKDKYIGSKNPKAKRIICITTNTVFDCMIDGANYYGIPAQSISKCCRGIIKSGGKLSDGTKLVWRYIDIIEI